MTTLHLLVSSARINQDCHVQWNLHESDYVLQGVHFILGHNTIVSVLWNTAVYTTHMRYNLLNAMYVFAPPLSSVMKERLDEVCMLTSRPLLSQIRTAVHLLWCQIALSSLWTMNQKGQSFYTMNLLQPTGPWVFVLLLGSKSMCYTSLVAYTVHRRKFANQVSHNLLWD